jgi:pimeloyl-ACP methyl ester carboxylesterase
VGAEDGHPVLYFHSPATAGEELSAAQSAAEQLNLRLISLRRPSIVSHPGDDFVNTVAEHTEALVEALGVDPPAVVGWSGGAPYALAASVRLGRMVSAVHLVSPIPGPLRGPDALPNQTERLRQVAATSAASSWVTGPATLRDYQALASPWNFDVGAISQHVTIWAPTDDEIVPLHLLEHLAHALPSVDVVEVTGGHAWLMENWSAVLARSRD